LRKSTALLFGHVKKKKSERNDHSQGVRDETTCVTEERREEKIEQRRDRRNKWKGGSRSGVTSGGYERSNKGGKSVLGGSFESEPLGDNSNPDRETTAVVNG